MGRLTLLLNVLVGTLWLVLAFDLVRRPFLWPRPLGLAWRRAASAALAVLALGAGLWGPQPWRSTVETQATDPRAGQPASETAGSIRTPFAVYAHTSAVDTEGRTLRNERVTTLQLPLALLAFLALALGTQAARARRSPGTSTDHRGRATSASLVLFTALSVSGCGESAEGEATSHPDYEARRAERVFVDVRWDTLAHLVSGLNDTTLFSVSSASVVADEHGFWVADIEGKRLAHFNWEGDLSGYAGRPGQGPGEFERPADLDLDEEGTVWVYDQLNARITGYDREFRHVADVSLQGLPSEPDGFAVRPDGQAFYLMGRTERLHPMILDRSGRITRGDSIDVIAPEGSAGMALQGETTRDRGRDGWVFAFAMGDGFFRMRGLEQVGGQEPFTERVQFPTLARSVDQEGSRSSVVTQLRGMQGSAYSLWARDGELFMTFRGASPEAGRLLDRYDLDTGRYLDTMLLPRPGGIAMWEDRLVLAAGRPVPELLVLRAVR